MTDEPLFVQMPPEAERADELRRQFYAAFDFERAPNAITNKHLEEMVKGIDWRDVLEGLKAFIAKVRAGVDHNMMGPKLKKMSRAERIENEHRELIAMLPILEVLVPQVRDLLSERGRVLQSRPDYPERMLRIVKHWNEQIAKHGWQDVAPLCDHCMRPVFRSGGGWRDPDTWNPSTKHRGCVDNAKSQRKRDRDKQGLAGEG